MAEERRRRLKEDSRAFLSLRLLALKDQVTAEDRARGIPAMEAGQAHRTGHYYNERWRPRKDGTQFWGSGVFIPLREPGQSGCLKTLRDLTALHQAKEEQARLLHAVQRALGVGQGDLAADERKLTVALNARQHHVFGDEDRLQRVFWNLLKNAAKYTPGGGQIAVRSDSVDGNIVVEVSDGGIGIEADTLPRVFEAFEQGNAKHTHRYGGLGLGLAISHTIVAAHGGQITAESAGPNQGATFRVRLPLKAG